ncbi:14261_t:CDS:2 [Gigaspora rosea]|nr:14261_t:CDS:2 [Gigaspora rosea]
MIVCAIGAYPVDREDSEVEIVSFVSTNPAKRDPETKAVFERDGFYSIGRKIVPVYYGDVKRPKMTISVSTGVVISNSAINANKCPMKVSLVGIPQELPRVIDNESAIFDVSVCDYVGKEIKFVVKIVFQYAISRFAHLKNTIRPHDSLVFVIGQLEVIVNEFYIYAKDINFVNTQFLSTQKSSTNSSLTHSFEAASVVRSKLIATHHNVKSSKEDSDVKASSSRSSNDFEIDNQLSSSLDNNFSKKRVKIEDVDKVNDVSVDNEKINFNLNEGNKDDDKIVKKDKWSKSSRGRKGGKGGVNHFLRSSSKVHNVNRNIEEE